VGRQRRHLRLAPLFALAAAWVAPLAGAQPAAWRVAGDNGGEVTLLGSMHVLRERDYPLPPLVDRLFNGADVLVMELDLDDIEPAEEQSTILGAATLKPGTVLRDVLDADVYRLAEQRSSALGLDLKLLENFEPWFIAITIQELGMRKLGFDGEHGLEQYLVRKSRQAGKEIEGLETLAYQIGIFDALPPRSQQAMLAQTLQEIDEAEETATRMADAWRAGDLGRLTDDLLEDFADFPGLYETLVTDRNAEWQKAIDKLLREGRRYLVVVGALHLVGRDNLIDMLRARGHEVERLR
jgi:uncharacterized protein YbaP (TraB family)